MDDNRMQEPELPTHFAPARRAGPEGLHRNIEVVSRHPMTSGILEAVYGLLAVLNEQRQIVALNDSLLATLGIKDAERVLGLRPGEAIECIHAQEEPGGCGTSSFCSTCGAAIAIVTALGTDRPVERECAIAAERDGKQVDCYFVVRCCPLDVEGERFLLLFLRDISAEQQRAALERVFYHDVSGLAENLLVRSKLLSTRQHGDKTQKLVDQIEDLASRLAKEVRIQKAIVRGPSDYEVKVRPIALDRILCDLQQVISSHPAAAGKTLDFPPGLADLQLSTDDYLLERVLRNMVTNALEATTEGGEVRLWIEDAEDAVVFCVWNRQCIPEDIARRVFQRNFSTKEGGGRGLGTYAMRLLGETFLQGKVSFTTSEAEGTVFRLWLPKNPPPRRLPA